MSSEQQTDHDFDAPSHDQCALAEDLGFLEAWENGLIPWLGAYVRVRQIRLANPGLAAERRPMQSRIRPQS